MLKAPRTNTAAVVIAWGAAAAVLAATAGCPSPVIVPAAISTVTLDVAAILTGTSDTTRIDSLHIWPQGAGTSLYFPADGAAFTVVNADGIEGDTVPAVAQLKGVAAEEPLDIRWTGRANLTLESLVDSDPMRLLDGFGNSLPIGAITVSFDVLALGQTNLSPEWRLRLPMNGAPASLANATFYDVPIETQVSLAVGNTAVGTAAPTTDVADLTFAGPATGTVRPVSSATVSFTHVEP